jgi:hypothetical protein
MRLAVEDWNEFGWVIVDNDADFDADLSDDEGGFARMLAYGFADEYDARLWITIFELQRGSGVRTIRQDFSDWSVSSG